MNTCSRRLCIVVPVLASLSSNNTARAFSRNAALFSSIRCGSQRPTAPETLTVIASGVKDTLNYAVNIQKNGKNISPWHDLPLKSGAYYNFVCEVSMPTLHRESE
jgi:hypothetical protein